MDTPGRSTADLSPTDLSSPQHDTSRPDLVRPATGSAAFASGSLRREWPLAFCLSLMLMPIAYLPYLCRFAWTLWNRDHYQFFPLVLVAAVALLCNRARGLGVVEPDKTSRARTLGFTAFVLLAIAVVLESAWLSAGSCLLLVLGIAGGIGGPKLAGAARPGLVLLLLIMPPPFDGDLAIVARCQTWSTVGASTLLDLLSVAHAREGNVLLLPEKKLMVEQACSGMNTLLPGLATALFLGFYLRRPSWHILLLMLGSLVFLLLGNLIRLTILGVAMSSWKVDLSEGWPHILLGVTIYLFFVCLLISQDQLLRFFSDGVPAHQSKRVLLLYKALGSLKFSADIGTPLRRQLKPKQDGAAEQNSTTEIVNLQNSWLATWPAILCLSLLLVGEAISAMQLPAGSFEPVEVLGPIAIPTQLAGWEQDGSQGSELIRSNLEGTYSQSWHYRRGLLRAVAAIDYPFYQWHPLWRCYQGQGWTVLQQAQETNGADGLQSSYQVLMINTLGHRGLLQFGLVDTHGQWQRGFLPSGPLDLLVSRLSRPLREVYVRPAYQLQTFVVSRGPMTDTELDQSRELFEAFQQRLLPELPIVGLRK